MYSKHSSLHMVGKMSELHPSEVAMITKWAEDDVKTEQRASMYIQVY